MYFGIEHRLINNGVRLEQTEHGCRATTTTAPNL